MKLLIRSLLVAAVLAGIASADTPAPPARKVPPPAEKDKPAPPKAPPQKTEVSAADAEKFLGFFNKVVDAMVANQDDCAKLTKEVSSIIDANVELVKKMQDAKAANKDLPADAKQKMLGRVKEMTPALQKCGQDPGFKAAMLRVNNRQEPQPPKDTKPVEKAPPTKK